MKTWEKKLRPYADLIARLNRRIERATPLELLALSRAVEKPTQTNCWWATYQAAALIAPLVKSERLRRRARR